MGAGAARPRPRRRRRARRGAASAASQYGEDANNLLPGALIAREGGALVTDADGHAWTPASPSCVAAPAALHADVLRVLAAVPAHEAA
ncbi:MULTISPECIES: hypothetical protein [Streptomyces]|uniref:hypothetical protein n=1 Tax=Streptomyces TaxID=1883 RepID=UPI0029CB92D8|nr:hypothetical protein [Streptomyces sp. F8]MDX6760821.1 hypothetical protein [Streptomyces sp. F8]